MDWVLLFVEPPSFPKTDAIPTVAAAAGDAAEMARNRNKFIIFRAVFVSTIMIVVTASAETVLEPPVSSLRDNPVSIICCCGVDVAVVTVARRGDGGNRIDSVGPQDSSQTVRLPLQATDSHLRVSLFGLRATRGG